jgi:hypothetical protein
MPPDCGLADKRHSGVKGSKVRLTYAFVSNASGSEKMRPLIIGKAKKPRAFGNKTGTQLGFYYRNNAKAWMTTTLYQEWILDWDRKLQAEGRKILLLQDNFSGHVVPDGLQNICIVNFAPNHTAHVQPMDQGIICCFKAHYRSRYIQCAIHRYDEGITPSEIYDINQLQAMCLAEDAWNNVDATTICNCWKKAGILPSSDSPLPAPSVPISSLILDAPSHEDPVLNAEKQVEQVLDGLVSRGILQKSNRMDIEALLNPIEESQAIDKTTDEEIYSAVQNAREAQELAEVNGGDDDVDDILSRREVLKATSLINRYINAVDDPTA